MTDDIALWSATRQAAAIHSKGLSSRELFDRFAARIERLNPAVNAVVTLDLERGQAAAAAADEATARGDALGPLHGLPITMKDALAVEGMRSTGGAIELTDHIPSADADCVAKVCDAGAFVFAKTNVPRWSGDLQTHNEIFPYDYRPDRLGTLAVRSESLSHHKLAQHSTGRSRRRFQRCCSGPAVALP